MEKIYLLNCLIKKRSAFFTMLNALVAKCIKKQQRFYALLV
jgi:hypothetical protein